ncbi:PLP-dependent aminotransferase family protein [Phreatobacter stygius]|uniref:PLP-dependent aminotransferase family protein n=1 Tax=Phreatobacter stygius TaxID=1940610 RepID=A0A4D7AYR7_9HYPH|nr:PLP-dependent aminotransferase family protein [Phreatobacter stygius]QCI65441.1 PLP-dependent aminotransferase family protein [Phreatobacter stygius]
MRLASPWQPRLGETAGPPYERLVAALAEDIAAGSVPAGARLPPHRDLAFQLGIGLGTVTRAYAVLERRGLVQSERGRGMFVAGSILRARTVVDLSVNTPPQMLSDRLMTATLATLTGRLGAESFGRYCPAAGRDDHRMLMARWLADHRLAIAPDRLLLCNGAQHALSIALALACPRGGLLLTEAVTYPGAIALARHADYRMKPLDIDEEGLRPEALDRALRSRTDHGPVALYVTPTLQNPTAATMGLARRQDIVRLCRAHDVTIVEDDVYSLFTPPDLPALAALAPERSLYVNGLSKNLSPGLRIGVLATPPGLIDRALAMLQTTSTMASPLCNLIMAQWLTDGTATSVGASVRAEAARRMAMARAALPGQLAASGSNGFHAWLPMPMAAALHVAEGAAALGVMVTPPSALAVDPTVQLSGIRLCLGAPPPDELAHGLAVIAKLLAQGAGGDYGLPAVI